MRCLFLDLASHNGCLACVADDAVIASEPVDHRISDHELIPIFEKTLDAAGWQSHDLTHVACIIGPGGFMSLRVAVAFANTLIHQLGILGAGVHLSDLYAARSFSSSGFDERTSIPQPLPPSLTNLHPPAPSSPTFAKASVGRRGGRGELLLEAKQLHENKHPPSPRERGLGGEVGKNKSERGEGGEVKTTGIGKGFLWLHSTKRNELFVRGFGEYAKLWSEATHMTVDDFFLQAAEVHEPRLRWCGELIPEHEVLFQEKKLQPVVLCPLADVLPAFLQRQTFTDKLLEPWYGRSW